MSETPPLPSDLVALATETCNLWQEHLAALASDPAAKAELMRLTEPSRQLFAEWTKKVQNGDYGASSTPNPFAPPRDAPATTASGATAEAVAADRAASAGAASDDGALRMAQLACRVAELENRIAQLEARAGGTAVKPVGAARQRRA